MSDDEVFVVGKEAEHFQTEEDSKPKIGSASGKQRRSPVYVSVETGYPLERYVIPGHYEPYLSWVMLPHGLMQDRTERLAADIREDFGNSTPHFLCVLKGAAEFFNDLSKYLRRYHEYFPRAAAPYTFDFIRVKSYLNDKSTGTVKIIGAELGALKGRDVIIVEDIIDSGLTMKRLIPVIRAAGANSVRVASLLEKRTTRSCGFVGDYVGFSVPDEFIVGYNMDYNELFRDLRHLCVLNEAGKTHFREPDIPGNALPSTPLVKARAVSVEHEEEDVDATDSDDIKIAVEANEAVIAGAGSA